MDEITKNKNLLDLKYQKLLNYLNISIITIITSFITIIVGTYKYWILNYLIAISIILFIIIILLWVYFDSLLEDVREEIKSL